ncbi:MAG: hypothetical protein PHI59_07580, partial [Candidatus Omnitrophica bacterium]|nr:hypothetical protein [Candidatus Omnitrophota bacterium]
MLINFTTFLALFLLLYYLGRAIFAFALKEEDHFIRNIISFPLGLSFAVCFIIISASFFGFANAVWVSFGSAFIMVLYYFTRIIASPAFKIKESYAQQNGVKILSASIITLLIWLFFTLRVVYGSVGHENFIKPYTAMLRNNIWPLTWPASPFGGRPVHIFYTVTHAFYNTFLPNIFAMDMHYILTLFFILFTVFVLFAVILKGTGSVLCAIFGTVLFFMGDFNREGFFNIPSLVPCLMTGRMCVWLFAFLSFYFVINYFRKPIFRNLMFVVFGINVIILNDDALGYIFLGCFMLYFTIRELVYFIVQKQDSRSLVKSGLYLIMFFALFIGVGILLGNVAPLMKFIHGGRSCSAETSLLSDVTFLFPPFTHINATYYCFMPIGKALKKLSPLFFYFIFSVPFAAALFRRTKNDFYWFSLVTIGVFYIVANQVVILYHSFMLFSIITFMHSMIVAAGGIMLCMAITNLNDARKNRFSEKESMISGRRRIIGLNIMVVSGIIAVSMALGNALFTKNEAITFLYQKEAGVFRPIKLEQIRTAYSSVVYRFARKADPRADYEIFLAGLVKKYDGERALLLNTPPCSEYLWVYSGMIGIPVLGSAAHVDNSYHDILAFEQTFDA